MIRIDAPPEAAPDGVTELSFAFTGTREELTAEQEGGPAIKYSAGDNANVTTDTATSIAVLDCLHNAGGAELSYAELLSRTGVPDEHLNAILRTVSALRARHAALDALQPSSSSRANGRVPGSSRERCSRAAIGR